VNYEKNKKGFFYETPCMMAVHISTVNCTKITTIRPVQFAHDFVA